MVLGKVLSNPVCWKSLSYTWYIRIHPRSGSAEALRWAVAIVSLNTPDGHWRDSTSCLANIATTSLRPYALIMCTDHDF